MTTTNERNIKIYKYYFVDRDNDFGDWLNDYLTKQIHDPFVLSQNEEYELDALLDTILTNFPKKAESVHQALIQALQSASHSLDLSKLSEIAFAAARAGVTPVATELAHSIDNVMEILARSSSLSGEEKAERVLQLDTVIASIAGLALHTDDMYVAATCRRLFYNPKLALFSSLLFAPVAVNDLKNWPYHWTQVVKMATTSMKLAPQKLDQSPITSPVPDRGYKKAHFHLRDVFENFLAKVLGAGFSLQDIFSAAESSHNRDQSNEIEFAFRLVNFAEENRVPVLGVRKENTNEFCVVIFVLVPWLSQHGLQQNQPSMVVKFCGPRAEIAEGYFDRQQIRAPATELLKESLIVAAA